MQAFCSHAMPATIIDSSVFRNMFSTPAMRDSWSDEYRTARYLDVERALAQVRPEAEETG